MEYGCGTAPITASYFEFYAPKVAHRIILAEIETLAFHYGAYRFRRCSNVIPILLLPENDFQLGLEQPVDAIFCITVFEHLNQPMETIQRFYDNLAPGGLLFFDYIKGDGDGMDTIHGVREREAVLDYVATHFDVLEGTLEKENSMSLTIVRKR
jgi:SAM-dependent methyltransferase